MIQSEDVVVDRIMQRDKTDRDRVYLGSRTGFPFICSPGVIQCVGEIDVRSKLVLFGNEVCRCNAEAFERLHHAGSTVYLPELGRRVRGVLWEEVKSDFTAIQFPEHLVWLGELPFLLYRPYVVGEMAYPAFRRGYVALKSEADDLLREYLARSSTAPRPE